MAHSSSKSRPSVAVYSGSFNPPAVHHQAVVRELVQHFDRVTVVPAGNRPEQSSADRIGRVFRATMADLAFGAIERTSVDLFDLEQRTFTRTHELEQRFSSCGDVWHVVGTNLVVGGGAGKSLIHCSWADGDTVWRTMNFAVIRRPDETLSESDLPPKHRVFVVGEHGSSTEVRRRLFHGESIEELVCPEVERYIERHQLYSGGLPPQTTRWQAEAARLMIVADERNAKARELAERFALFVNEQSPNLILVIGGDGSMLHAIQAHWRRRLPFFGINAGHLGFLMNEADEVCVDDFPGGEIVLRQLPMIHADFQLADGSWREGFSFNDVWIERKTGQTAWLQLTVAGKTRFTKLVGDGLLLSTAAGSTAYALSMGATPLLAETPAWLVVGNNVMQPRGWKSALLSLDDEVEVVVLDANKRPVHGFLYGTPVGEVRAMRARISKIAAVELGFCPQHDMAHKIAELQFPSES